MYRPVHRQFFEPSAAAVAPRLLGFYLLRQTPDGPVGGPIVETEAYLRDDPACHAYAGHTARNRSMWEKPGTAYVYFIYGNHFCVNAVCCPAGTAEAVLIRAIEPAFGLEFIRRHRPVARLKHTTDGPGKLCAALQIDRSLDGVDLCRADSPLIVAQNPEHAAFLERAGPVLVTPRVGITQAAERPLRFALKNSEFISRRTT